MYKTLWRKTLLLWLFSMVKIPLIFWLKPRIMELTDDRGVILIRFRRRTKNHVNSMYFGALCVGAELSAGILVMNYFRRQKEKYTFVFKNFSAEFVKRCEADVFFVCEQGTIIYNAIQQAQLTKERQNVALNVNGIINDEIVCKFTLTLSLKQK